MANNTFKLSRFLPGVGRRVLVDVADLNPAGKDGKFPHPCAIATYDFAKHGGAIGAIPLGVVLPDNAVLLGGALIDVVTTCTTAGADAGTMAVSVQGANDVVAAVAVSDVGNPWDAGTHVTKQDGATPTFPKVDAAAGKEITATIAGQAFTAGKFHVILPYIVAD